VVAMPVTRRGVYHNLKESKYTISNSEVVFFFSSEHTLNKFMDGYQNYRNIYRQKLERLDASIINLDTTADITFYKQTEKRGFYVWLKGVSMTPEDMYSYAIRKMTEKNSPVWERIEKPRTAERFK
jgi:YHS domain-containing protein